MPKITVVSRDGVRLWTNATVKGSNIARELTEKSLREFALTQDAATLREDEYFDVVDPEDYALAYGRMVPTDVPLI